MDSVVSYHCDPKREYFSTYKVGDFGVVNMGNKSVFEIERIGDICIQTSIGCTLTRKYVHMLDKDGYNHFIRSGNWNLTKES